MSTDPSRHDVSEHVRRLFTSDGAPAEKELDARLSKSIDNFLRATMVSTEVEFDALSDRFRESQLPDGPGELENYLHDLENEVIAHSINVSSPKFIGHMTSALPYFVRPIGRLLTALNQNLVKVETAKALTPYEREALGMLHRLVYECPDAFYAEHLQSIGSTLGVVTSGGTLANVTGLWVARNRALGPRDNFVGVERAGIAAALKHYGYERAVIVGSALMHYSIEKAADVLGLGTDALVRVPVGTDSRVKPEALREALERCHAARELVIAVVGIAGTTDTGAIDPLEELAEIAGAAGVHLHVDAAWGGPLLFSATHRPKLAGIAKADSITIDGHKQLYLPMGIGIVLMRDPGAASAIEKQAQYIIRRGSADLGKRALEGSRPGMALFLHAGLRVLGRAGYEHIVDEGIRKTRYLADSLQARPEFELLVEPQMNILNYRYVPPAHRAAVASGTVSDEANIAMNAANERLQELQRRAGRTFVSRTQVRYTKYGMPITALRVVLANPLTTNADIDSVLTDQLALAESLAGT